MATCVWGRFVGNAWLWKVLDIPAASVRSGNYHTENFVVGNQISEASPIGLTAVSLADSNL